MYAEHRARVTAQRNACISNLGFLQRGKAQWALENKKADSDFVSLNDIYRTLGAKFVQACPANGNYTVTTVAEQPVCSLSQAGHTL